MVNQPSHVDHMINDMLLKAQKEARLAALREARAAEATVPAEINSMIRERFFMIGVFAKSAAIDALISQTESSQ